MFTVMYILWFMVLLVSTCSSLDVFYCTVPPSEVVPIGNGSWWGYKFKASDCGNNTITKECVSSLKSLYICEDESTAHISLNMNETVQGQDFGNFTGPGFIFKSASYCTYPLANVMQVTYICNQ